MTVVIPDALQDAARTLTRNTNSIEEAAAAAALSTTRILSAGADEISTAITELFNTHGLNYQMVTKAAATWQTQFAGLLADAGNMYRGMETSNENMLTTSVTGLENTVGVTGLIRGVVGGSGVNSTPESLPTVTHSAITLTLGGTGGANPPQTWAQQIATMWKGGVGYSLDTPEQGFPFTPELGHLTFNQSFKIDVSLLNTAIHQELAQCNTVTVYGVSQSATAITLELHNLQLQGYPGVGHLSFILQGDPNNPNGGLMERLVGAYIPGFDVTGYGATPTNTPYPVSIYTNQYDPFADFPQYPLNFISDANAVAGLFAGQHAYFPVSPNWIQQPTSPGYTGNTRFYYSLDTGPLPLTWPLRQLGAILNPYDGNSHLFTAVADAIQPDLRVLSDMGYGTGQYADIPTPYSLFEIPNIPVIAHDLMVGTGQGVAAFGVDMGWLPNSMFPNAYPYISAINPNLNLPLPQTGTTGLSMLSGAEGQLVDWLSWD